MTEPTEDVEHIEMGSKAPPGSSALAVRHTQKDVRRPRLTRGLAAVRTRLPTPVRDPVVVTTATVGAGVAARVIRELVRTARVRGESPARAVPIAWVFVHRVDVVHHVVHYVTDPARAVERRGVWWR